MQNRDTCILIRCSTIENLNIFYNSRIKANNTLIYTLYVALQNFKLETLLLTEPEIKLILLHMYTRSSFVYTQ